MGLCDYRFHPKINEMGPEAQQNNHQSTSDWLGKNELAEKDDLEVKQHELDGVVNPIQVASGAGGSGRGLAPAAPALGADFIRMFGDGSSSVAASSSGLGAALAAPDLGLDFFRVFGESADAVMLRKNKLAEKDKFEVKQQELDGIVNPIMQKVYQAADVEQGASSAS
jgi:hypothetical protein